MPNCILYIFYFDFFVQLLLTVVFHSFVRYLFDRFKLHIENFDKYPQSQSKAKTVHRTRNHVIPFAI